MLKYKKSVFFLFSLFSFLLLFSPGDVKYQSSVLKDALPRSERSVRCLGPVDGFTLEAEDIDYVCTQFFKDLQGENVQRALK